MAANTPLSRAELEVAQTLWKLKEATVRQVFEAIPEEREIDFWTVQTLLRRLEAKDYLKSRLEGRTRIYKAKVKPATVVKRLTNDFVDRVFDGEAIPLFQHLLRHRDLNAQEIEKLRQMLDEQSKEQ